MAKEIKNDFTACLYLGIMRLRKKGKQIETNFLIKIRSFIFLSAFSQQNLQRHLYVGESVE